MQIKITNNYLVKAGIQNSPSGRTIDELAFAAGQWTEEDLFSNNFEYEPFEPYSFNYEDDLFKRTKTIEDLRGLAKLLNADSVVFTGKTKLQAGAYMALNHPEKWAELLKAYTAKLKEDRTEGISEEYNKVLQGEIDSFWKDMRKEWLYGDYRDFAGVIVEISKYFMENYDNGSYDEKTDVFTFEMEPDAAHDQYCGCGEDKCKEYKTIKSIKPALIYGIKTASDNKRRAHEVEMEKRREEHTRLKEQKAERKKEEEAERKEKLLKMKL